MFIELLLAIALQDSTTTCSTAFGQTTCRTRGEAQQASPTGAMNSTINSLNQLAPRAQRSPEACAGGDWFLAGCTLGEHREAVRLRDAAATATDLRGEVILLVRDGNCLGAINAALDGGDLGLATEVRNFCAAGSVSPK